MALTVTASQIAPVYPESAEIYDYVAGSAVTPGQGLKWLTSGKVALANGAATATSYLRGVALGSAGAGQAVSMLKRGHVYGYDLTGLDAGQLVYLDNSNGALATAAGTVSVVAGIVTALPENSNTKVLYIDADWKR